MTMNHDGVGGWIERWARANGDRTALVFGETRVTYTDLAARIRRLAHGLRRLGVRKGDRVAWTGANHPAFLETLFASAKLGAPLVPIDHRLGPDVIERLVDEVRPRTIRSADRCHEDLIASHPDSPIEEAIDPDDVCLMPFTPGTTGAPKRVMLTHANLTWNAINAAGSLDIRADDVGLAVTPFSRAGGTGVTVLPVLFRGGTVVLAARPEPDAVLRLVEQHQVTLGFAGPDFLAALARSRRWRVADLGSLRSFVVGGQPAREQLLRECVERGVPVREGYGLTEAAPIVSMLDDASVLRKIGSVGRPALFVDVRVVAMDGSDRTPGEIGELLVGGPNIMNACEWLHTGDAAYLDAEGFLFIVGRMADAYEVAGTTVHPGIAERVLLRHAAVAEVCVIGGDGGATAHVALAPDAAADIDAELRELAETLPVRARPTAFTYVASLPRNANGKVLRRRLSPAASHEGEESMNATMIGPESQRYARTVESSKKVRWEIDKDVIRGRRFDRAQKFLPDGLSLAGEFTTLSAAERVFISQIQGRTYANIFGLVERFINAKVLELSHEHWFGDQVALEALVRFSDEELKHQELFRRIDRMMGEVLPAGYRCDVDANAVAHAVLGKSTWAVLALTLDIELFTQVHYTESIAPDRALSELFKDVFLFHWKEESQHAILDELELMRDDAEKTPQQRDRAVDEFIDLVGAVDGILQVQARNDAGYFVAACGRGVDATEARAIEAALLKAYRWQYIHSGAQQPHFGKVLSSLITSAQGQRIQAALATLRS